MAILVVRTEDTIWPDPVQNASAYKRGDVIDIVDDGWQFGSAEIGNPRMMFVAMPGIPKDSLSGFLAADQPNPLTPNSATPLNRRSFSFDIAGYQAAAVAVPKGALQPFTLQKALTFQIAKPL